MKTIQTALAICFAAAIALAAGDQKPMTNADVVAMISGGLSESTIVMAIKQGTSSFDTSPASLIQLKTQGASPAILEAMIGTQSISSSNTKAGEFAGTSGSKQADTTDLYISQDDLLAMAEHWNFDAKPLGSTGIEIAVGHNASEFIAIYSNVIIAHTVTFTPRVDMEAVRNVNAQPGAKLTVREQKNGLYMLTYEETISLTPSLTRDEISEFVYTAKRLADMFHQKFSLPPPQSVNMAHPVSSTAAANSPQANESDAKSDTNPGGSPNLTHEQIVTAIETFWDKDGWDERATIVDGSIGTPKKARLDSDRGMTCKLAPWKGWAVLFKAKRNGSMFTFGGDPFIAFFVGNDVVAATPNINEGFNLGGAGLRPLDFRWE